MKKFLFLFLILFCVLIKIIAYIQDTQTEVLCTDAKTLNINDDDSNKAFETYLEGTITSYQTNAKIIGDWAFFDRKNLSVLVISKANLIEDSVFYNCFELKYLILDNQEQMIELLQRHFAYYSNSFRHTPILSGEGFIYVPDHLYEQYMNNKSWSFINKQIKTISELDIEYKNIANSNEIVDSIIDKSITYINIPAKIDNLCGFAFYNCQKLEKVDIYALEEIPKFCFWKCNHLKEITYIKKYFLEGERAFYETIFDYGQYNA